MNSQAVCSCLPLYHGSPPSCRPECVSSTECSYDKSCVNQKCVNPCPGTCGQDAQCVVKLHSPICSCKHGFTGNPFTICYPIPRKLFFLVTYKVLYNRDLVFIIQLQPQRNHKKNRQEILAFHHLVVRIPNVVTSMDCPAARALPLMWVYHLIADLSAPLTRNVPRI